MQETQDLDGRLTDEQTIIRAAMNRDVRAPLAALTAAMEFLAGDFQEDDPHNSIIDSMLEELARLGRSVETLYRHSVPATIMPLRCSVEELCRSTITLLPDIDAQRIWLAMDQVDEGIFVDGPLLTHCLAAFLEDAIQRGSEEVLFHAHQSQNATFFAIVDDLVAESELQMIIEAAGGDEDLRDSFPVQLARRDVERMGGSVSITRSTPNQSCVMVRFDVAFGELER
jgi:K+-sensing histidine kinase KdpD